MATSKQPAFSCEFFPPRTDAGRDSWRDALTGLAALKPAFFSCTYGAGGTTQSGTRETVEEIIASGHAAAAHITCIGSTEEKIRAMSLRFYLKPSRIFRIFVAMNKKVMMRFAMRKFRQYFLTGRSNHAAHNTAADNFPH